MGVDNKGSRQMGMTLSLKWQLTNCDCKQFLALLILTVSWVNMAWMIASFCMCMYGTCICSAQSTAGR